MMRTTLEMLLADDFVVSSARDGASAVMLIENARAESQSFDAVLCDFGLPGATGDALLEKLVAADGGLFQRVLFMTGGVHRSEDHDFLRRVPCVEKPFDATELINKVTALAASQKR